MSSQSSSTQPTTYTQKVINNLLENLEGEIDIDIIHLVAQTIKNFAAEQQALKRATSDRLPFGKFKGKSMKALFDFGEAKYLAWLVKQDMMNNFPELKLNIESVLSK